MPTLPLALLTMLTSTPITPPVTVKAQLPATAHGDDDVVLQVPVLLAELLLAMRKFAESQDNLLEFHPPNGSKKWRKDVWMALRTWCLYCKYLRVYHGTELDGELEIKRQLQVWRVGIMQDLRAALWLFDNGMLNIRAFHWPPPTPIKAHAVKRMDRSEHAKVIAVHNLKAIHATERLT